MKKLLKNEGKIASIIILAGFIFSFGVFFVSHDAHALRIQSETLPVDPYDGGGGGGGGGYTPPPNPFPPPTGGATSGNGTPMATDPRNWPQPGVTKKLAWCTNNSTHDYKTTCEGTDLQLWEFIPETVINVSCEGREKGTVLESRPATLMEIDSPGLYTESAVDSNDCTQRVAAYWKKANSLADGCAYTNPNACGEKALGMVGYLPPVPPISVPNYGKPCKSPVNACGATTDGTIGCDALCSAKTAPATLPPFGEACTSAANKCGQTISGTRLCNEGCSVSAAPPVTDPSCGKCGGKAPAPNYNQPCTSAANVCGMTNAGAFGCDGTCNATKPSDSLCQKCTATNACKQSNTGYVVNGVCNVTAPANPAGFGSKCSSQANSCLMKATGMIGCDGNCSASTPSEQLCPQPCQSTPNACGQTTSGVTGLGDVCQAVTPPNPDVYVKTGKCTPPTCTINERLNLTTYTCETIPCKPNQVLTNGKCVDVICNIGEKLVGNVCQPIIAPVNAVCSKTIVNKCEPGAFLDKVDSGTQNLWTCKGSSGGTDAECAIDIFIPKTPTVTVNPPTSSFSGGGTVTFNWNVKDATTCSLYKKDADDIDSVLVRAAGMVDSYTNVISKTTNYDVRCTNIAGNAPYPTATGVHSATVAKVTPPPPPAPKAPVLTVLEQPRGGMSVAFGNVVAQPLTIRNDGELTLVGTVSLQNDANKTFSFEQIGEDLKFSLAANQTKTFNFKYIPKRLGNDVPKIIGMNKKANLAALGSLSILDKVDIVIDSNAGNESHKVLNINQNGVDAVSGDASLNVGEVPVGVQRVFRYTVRNNTTNTVESACVKINGAKVFSVTTDTIAINPGQVKSFDITFKPKVIDKTPVSENMDVGVMEAGACKTIYTANLTGVGVKPIGKFNEI